MFSAPQTELKVREGTARAKERNFFNKETRMVEDALNKGKQMLEEVVLRYAAGHGLHPKIEWDDQGYQWLLRAVDEKHTVRLVFSPDEIEFFAEDLPENRETKKKISNAFASLSM